MTILNHNIIYLFFQCLDVILAQLQLQIVILLLQVNYNLIESFELCI